MQSFDYDRLMQANLVRVFSERDAAKRLEAIAELYAEDAVLHEPDASFEGHASISQAVTDLLNRFPADFAFTAIGPATGHHSIGRLQWKVGPPNGPVAATGMDIVHVEGERIHSLHVFIEPSS